jgi:hypothetical protein
MRAEKQRVSRMPTMARAAPPRVGKCHYKFSPHWPCGQR